MTDVNSVAYWDATYERHAREGTTAITVAERMPAWQGLLPLLPGSGSLLDVGCAGGEFLHFVRQHRPRLELWGIDHSAVAIRLQTEPSATYLCGDGVSLELCADETFDVVYSGHFIEHVADPTQAFASQLRVLRPDGLLIVLFPHGDGPYVEHVWSDLTLDTIAGWLSEAGFSDFGCLPLIEGSPVDQAVITARRRSL